MVTTSTSSWVAARSGADSHTKLTHDTSSAPPVGTSAARRWNLAWLAAPIAQAAQAAPRSHSSANAGSTLDQHGWKPNGTLVAARPPASSASSTIHSSCDCSRRLG